MTLIKINNININYVEVGKGKPFIFLHGIYFDSSGYKKLIEIISKYYKVYAIDLPMHGKSEKPKKYMPLTKMSKIVEGFVKKQKIKNPVVCGHSGGALVAMDYATKNKVKELVLIDPAGVKYASSITIILLRIAVIKTITSLYYNPIGFFKMAKVGLRNFFKNLFNPNYWKMLNKNLEIDYTSKMKKIKSPTKLIWAKHDEVTPYKYAAKFKQNIKNCKIIEVKGNHSWPALKPEQIKKYLNK